jgi:SAM-dependent methyltransferase
MDMPCSYDDMRSCLRDIGRINRLTWAYRPTLIWLDELAAARPAGAGPLRLVDVGCGYGDMLRRIDAWASRRGIAVALTGIDSNGDAIRAAREATSPGQKIEWKVGNALTEDPATEIDIVLCSLLTHHLENEQIVRLLQWMEKAARRGWFINDLHRQAIPYRVLRLWGRFSNWHPFVRHDGPVSIRRSFVAEDWRRLCAAAGCVEDEISIREFRPARLCVGRIK